MKSIQFSSGKDSLYISHNWRDSGVSAISMLKQESLQQIFGFWFSISHASYLNTRKYMIKVLSLIGILDTLSYNIKTVFDSPINDFEDALIEEISYQNKLSYIVTRNTKDFKNSRVKVVTPKKLLTIIKNSILKN